MIVPVSKSVVMEQRYLGLAYGSRPARALRLVFGLLFDFVYLRILMGLLWYGLLAYAALDYLRSSPATAPYVALAFVLASLSEHYVAAILAPVVLPAMGWEAWTVYVRYGPSDAFFERLLSLGVFFSAYFFLLGLTKWIFKHLPHGMNRRLDHRATEFHFRRKDGALLGAQDLADIERFQSRREKAAKVRVLVKTLEGEHA